MIVPSCGIVSEALFFPLLLMGPPIISLGDQLTPTFSPDGRQVAFTWNGDAQDNFDIYLKLVNSSSPPLRLTTNKDIDYSPAWSPDGEWIAFCRGTDTLGGAVWIVPALGAERKIVELDTLASPANRFLAWSRDSSKLVVSARIAGVSGGLHLVDINNGVRRTITAPSPSEEDMHPAVSNDGKMVAFTRDVGLGVSQIMTVPIEGGKPQLITSPQHVYNARPTWTPDGTHTVRFQCRRLVPCLVVALSLLPRPDGTCRAWR